MHKSLSLSSITFSFTGTDEEKGKEGGTWLGMNKNGKIGKENNEIISYYTVVANSPEEL